MNPQNRRKHPTVESSGAAAHGDEQGGAVRVHAARGPVKKPAEFVRLIGAALNHEIGAVG